MLAAWIRRLDLVEVRQRVPLVDRIQEEDTGLTAGIGALDYLGHDVLRENLPDRAARARTDEIKVQLPVQIRLHECVRDSDRDVEAVQCVLVRLARDEVEDVGMVDTEDAHRRTAPRP